VPEFALPCDVDFKLLTLKYTATRGTIKLSNKLFLTKYEPTPITFLHRVIWRHVMNDWTDEVTDREVHGMR